MKRILLSFVFLLSATTYANQTVRTTSEGSVKLSIDVPSMTGQSASLVDILFVVDDSGSMDAHQVKIATSVPQIVGKLAGIGAHFHAGVVTSSMGSSGKFPGNGELVNGFVESSDPQFMTKFARNLEVGSQGSGTEMLFAPVMTALSEPMISGKNAGFLRPAAQLAVVFVSDADDQSVQTVQEMQTFLSGLKGSAFKTIAAIVPQSETRCQQTGESPPMKLEEFMGATQGTIASLCDPNLSDVISGALASMIVSNPNPVPQPAPVYDRVIELPSKATLSSIVVKYDSQTLLFGDAWAGWVFDSNKNAVIIGEGVALGQKPWMTKIEIEYQIAGWP